ncbi:MAG: hypothetical protein AAF632_18895 [Bacteroidota bacterium]
MLQAIYKLGSINQVCLAIYLGLLTSCASVFDIVIPPQEEFILGGNNRQAYSVKVQNRGNVPLQLAEKLAHDEEIDLGYLLVGDKRNMTFLAGSSAKFANISSDTAYLKLKVASREELKKTTNPR